MCARIGFCMEKIGFFFGLCIGLVLKFKKRKNYKRKSVELKIKKIFFLARVENKIKHLTLWCQCWIGLHGGLVLVRIGVGK